MKTLDCGECKVHVNVCTNERPAGASMPSCKNVGGYELYHRLKDKLRETGLSSTHWVTRTGCLGFCNQVGTTVVIYPKDRAAQWYSEVTDADFEIIWDEIARH